jgi:succinyl-diaminopimelate desuccinylase
MNNSLITILKELIEIPSLSLKESVIADFIFAKAFALQDSFDEAAVKIERLGNCIVVDVPKGESDFLALVGHLDTVPGQWFYEAPYNGTVAIDGNTLTGLGASDMKAGVALMVELMRPEVVANFTRSIRFVYYDHEEVPSDTFGLGPLFARAPWIVEHVECALILEPTDNGLQLGCMGLVNAEVTIKGKAAHSARPWQGDNSIYLALPLVEKARMFGVVEHCIETLVFKEVLTVTRMLSGVANNIVPGECLVNLNYRFPPSVTIESATNFIHEFVGDIGTINVTGANPSGSVPAMVGVLEKFRSKFDLSLAPKQAYTDVAVFSGYNVSAANFGPGHSAQCHQIGEYASLDLIGAAFDRLRWLCSS